MTLRLTFGADPGLTGCVATLLDGEPGPFIDMPTKEVGTRTEVDGKALADWIKWVMAQNSGAFVQACVEQVSARPMDGGTSAFRFGEGFGKVKAVLEVLNIPYLLTVPAQWKRNMGLIGTDKDMARQLAIRRFPSMAEQLKRKKDNGRADALLLALYLENKG